MTNFKKYWNHFKTITKHKIIVGSLCIKCGYIKRGLLHDLSKYSIVEFGSSAKYFQGSRSSIDAEKIEKGYSLAWQHHKGHNPHHWEYWIDNVGTYKNNPIEIPEEYIVEMVCDWVGAGIVYSGHKPSFNRGYSEPLIYFNQHRKERIFAPDTEKIIKCYLTHISCFGINSWCKMVKYIKEHQKKM